MAAPRNIDIRRLILDTTAQLLESASFNDVTLARIANAAHISKGTLYYYYSNKEDILFDITDRYLDTLAGDLLEWVDNKDKDTSLPRLMHFVMERGVTREIGNLRLYLIGAGVSGHDALRVRYIERYTQFHNALAQSIAARAPDADASYLAWLLLAVLDGMLVQRQLGNPAFGDDVFMEKTVTLANSLCEMPPKKSVV